MPANTVNGDLLVVGNLTLTGAINTQLARSNLAIESSVSHPVQWTDFRKSGDVSVNLPAAASGSDLGLVTGTFGTNVPSIQTGDVKNLGATSRYARFQLPLPDNYVAGQAVTVRLHCGMLTTIASAAATVAVECYKSGRETAVSGGNLCTTSAISINSTTFADCSFTITPSGLAPGDMLDIRVTIAVNDGGTVTAVIGCIGAAEVLLNVRG